MQPVMQTYPMRIFSQGPWAFNPSWYCSRTWLEYSAKMHVSASPVDNLEPEMIKTSPSLDKVLPIGKRQCLFYIKLTKLFCAEMKAPKHCLDAVHARIKCGSQYLASHQTYVNFAWGAKCSRTTTGYSLSLKTQLHYTGNKRTTMCSPR